MKREVLEETGLEVLHSHLYAVYSGERMQFTYPDGNQVVFVMFLFLAEANLKKESWTRMGKPCCFRMKPANPCSFNLSIYRISNWSRSVLSNGRYLKTCSRILQPL